jgi:hypothetical protein
MDCINGYIGIKGCPGIDEEPPSGLFINHLPGISFKSLVGLTDFDANTVRELWKQVQFLAGEMLEGDVVSAIRFKYNLKSSRRTIALIPDLLNKTHPPTTDERGIIINLLGVKSQFNHIYVSVISFKLANLPAPPPDGSSEVVFTLRDEGGTLLYQVNKVVTAQDVGKTIQVNVFKKFATDFLFIGASGDNLQAIGTSLSSQSCQSFCISVCEVCPDCRSVLTGGTYASGTYNSGGDTFGMGVTAGVGCSYANLVCANLDWFKMPLMFLCGYLLMVERLSSDRVNKWTTVGTATAEELRDSYREEYEARLKDILTGMELDESTDCCIECEQTVKRKIYLP